MPLSPLRRFQTQMVKLERDRHPVPASGPYSVFGRAAYAVEVLEELLERPVKGSSAILHAQQKIADALAHVAYGLRYCPQNTDTPVQCHELRAFVAGPVTNLDWAYLRTLQAHPPAARESYNDAVKPIIWRAIALLKPLCVSYQPSETSEDI